MANNQQALIVKEGVLAIAEESYLKPDDAKDNPTGILRSIIRFRAEWQTEPNPQQMAKTIGQSIGPAVREALTEMDRLSEKGLADQYIAELKAKALKRMVENIQSEEFNRRMFHQDIPVEAIPSIRDTAIAQINAVHKEMGLKDIPPEKPAEIQPSQKSGSLWTARLRATENSSVKGPLL